MAIFELREYQKEAKKGVRDAFSKGKKRVILCKPTGSGKTVTFANIARESVLNGFKVMIVVDRKELLDQAKDKLITYGLNPTLITSGRTGRKNSKTFIATVQTLVRRELPAVDLIIIDEAHKQIFDKILEREEYKDVFVIGATATPYRTGKMNQLGKYYNEMVEAVSISDLIGLGFLAPAITYGAKMDTSSIKVKGRDFDTESMYNAFDKSHMYSGVVEKYKNLANGTKAICFNINVAHSKKVMRSFLNEGIRAEHLDGTMKKSERERILSDFSSGAFDVLCNVDVLTTGYDEWTIETVIVNRATKSLPLWLQMCGRGSRITPAQFQGDSRYLQKEHFNIIDMGGNVFKLGFWEQDRDFSLYHKTSNKESVAPVKECKEKEDGCGAIIHASATSCKFCGKIFPKKEKKLLDSEFIQLENYQALPPELVGKSWGSMSFEDLEKVRNSRGCKQGWIIRQIIISNHLNLRDYAVYKNYKNPDGWVKKMNKIYIKK